MVFGTIGWGFKSLRAYCYTLPLQAGNLRNAGISHLIRTRVQLYAGRQETAQSA